MELTRRDALAVLTSAGVVGGGAAAALARDGFAEGRDSTAPGDGGGGDATAVVDAQVATARVVYPSVVENVGAFVESYAGTKLAERPAFREGAVEALADLDAQSTISFDTRFAGLDPGECDVVLRRVGADTAEPDPEGTAAERVRYYFVNEVLYALYASPTGGELVGIENPQGHPGGTDSYQRGPPG